MSSPTIKDVAKLAGVSISTVSRVMNDSKPVSPESRRKVEDAIEKLDFKRNELARSLVMKRSNLIGVLVKDLGIPYMTQIVRGVEEVGRMYKYDMLLNSSYGDAEQEKVIVDFMLRKQAEAIIMITENANPEVIVKLKENKNSFILLDRFYNGSFNTVTIDYENAAYKMTSHLITKGHKNILFVLDNSNNEINNAKKRGYKKAMDENNLDEIIFQSVGSGLSDGFATGKQIMNLYKDKVTAIFAGSDRLALGIMNYCQTQGISIPRDLSVAGFGDSEFAKDFTPALTTVYEPYYDIGAVAMRRVIKDLKEEEEIDKNVLLPVQILERDSIMELK